MRSLVVALSAAALIIVFLVHLIGGNRDAIATAQAESSMLATQRDSLVAVVQDREALIASLGIERDTLKAIADSRRDSGDILERDRAASELVVRETHTLVALRAALRSTFPELSDLSLRTLNISMGRGDTLGIEYLAVPAWFTETFIIDHQNAESWRAQRDRLLALDSLRVAVAALQDSIAGLQSANITAYRSGYDAAYAGYQDVSGKYVAELKKPRIRFASTLHLFAAAGAGLVIGTVIR